MTDRDAIRNNAKYLRNVRPIDPEEINEYVDGQPHPAVVKQILAEEALDLGLLQRTDGTFVPVPDDPIPHDPIDVTEFPKVYARRFEDALVDAYGPNWHRGDSADELQGVIRRMKADYFDQRDVTYDDTAALAYGLYHLPDFYAAIQYVLSTLTEKHLLDRELRVLDVGAGVGGPALGLHDFLPADALVDYHAIEPSANADVLEQLLEETSPNFHTTIHRTTAEAFDPPDSYDLVVVANVLNELEDPSAVLAKYVEAIEPDGAVLALAPADENTASGLRDVERAVVEETPASVYAPAVRLWPDREPSDRGWTFDVKPDLDVPEFQRRLNDHNSNDHNSNDHNSNDDQPNELEFVNVDVQYAFTILRTDGVRRVDVTANPDTYAKMADTETHVPNRIDAIAIKLSHDLTDDPDANPLFKIGDGSQAVDHYAVVARETALNAGLQTAEYGDVVTFENVLALWNDDEAAYNFVVDEHTTTEHVPAPV